MTLYLIINVVFFILLFFSSMKIIILQKHIKTLEGENKSFKDLHSSFEEERIKVFTLHKETQQLKKQAQDELQIANVILQGMPILPYNSYKEKFN